MVSDEDDPYDTGGIRRRVLRAWAESPDRFREDANAEEDLALGGYRDALVVELAQNAADAARRGGGDPARFLLRLSDSGLLAANTGARLDAAGVAALVSLRASAKRDDPELTGRFGVGFAAVVGVSPEPMIGSRGSAAVGFSARRTADAVAAVPALAAELRRRGGQVPVLRLPWALAPLEVPSGYDTAVWLPWDGPHAAAVRQRVEELLGGIDPTLLLTVPGLGEIRLELPGGAPQVWSCRELSPGVVDCAGVRWLVETATGMLPAPLLAARPVEERQRDRFRILAATPAEGSRLPGGVAAVLRAPQPTAEPVSLPVVLSVPVPLDPERRHARPGPLTEHLLAATGPVLAALAARRSDPLPLLPLSWCVGEVDAAVHQAARAALRGTAVLPGALGDRVAPTRAVCLDTGAAALPLTDLLAGEVSGLLRAEWSADTRRVAAASLGATVWGLAEVVGAVTGRQHPPGWWRRFYAAVADAGDVDALAAVPVPLVDGRMVTGARGALLAGEMDPADAAAVGAELRVVHPEAVHPLLERLGARRAGPGDLLAALRPLVTGEAEAPELARAELVLRLVVASGIRQSPGGAAGEGSDAVADWGWLAQVELPGDDGRWWPAADLVVPGSVADRLFHRVSDLPRVAPDLAARHPLTAFAGLGCLTGLLTDHAVAVHLDAPAALGVDGEESYLAELTRRNERPALESRRSGAGGGRAARVVDQLVVVRDLDLVADWPAALQELASDPALRAALLPAVGPSPSYTAWWLATHPVLDGRYPSEFTVGEDPRLDGVYDLAPPGVDRAVLRAIGCRQRLEDILTGGTADPGGVWDLLDRLGDTEREVTPRAARGLYSAAVAALLEMNATEEPPLAVRACLPPGVTPGGPAGRGTVVASSAAVVVDRPDLLPLLDRPYLPIRLALAPAAARLLGIPCASDILDAAPDGDGEWTPLTLSGEDAGLLTAAGLAVESWPEGWYRHAGLRSGGTPVSWLLADGVLHADGPVGLAHGLAWRAEQWSLRGRYLLWFAGASAAVVVGDATLEEV